MPANRCVDGTLALDNAPRQGLVTALDRPRLQLPDQIGLCLERLGDDHQATGILVEPMHDARPRHLVELRGVVQQGIEQSPAPVPAPRVDHQTGRLVDNHQELILVYHLQGDILRRRRLGAFVGRLGEFDGFASPELAPGLDDELSTDNNPPLAYPVLQPATRMLRQQTGKNLVHPLTAAIDGYAQGDSGVCAIIDQPVVLAQDLRLRLRRCFLFLWVFHHA